MVYVRTAAGRAEEPMLVWPLAVYFAVVILLVTVLLGLSALLGERHREPSTNRPYESGIASTGSARLRFGASFYLVAVFFVIFDLEAAFVFAWAVSQRQIGWAGYFSGVVFIAVVCVALAYVWRTGGLDLSSGRSARS